MRTHTHTAYEHATIARHLRAMIDGDVLDDHLNLALYSTDASIYQIKPACVVLPRSTEDVVQTVRYALENDIALVGRGGGTGVAGESLCSGIVIDFSRYLNRILSIDEDTGVVRCQPGVVFERLNTALAPSGWLFGPDPSSGISATIGGIVGNNATGSHSLKYGHADRWIDDLEVILPDGRLTHLHAQPVSALPDGNDGQLARAIYQLVQANGETIARCMPKAKRNRSGYGLDKVVQDGHIHLGRLIAGSEGTLAVITEATLQMVRRPKVKALLAANFQDLTAMGAAVVAAAGRQPATCELMDGGLIELARSATAEYRDILPAGVAASLLIEVDGDTADEVRHKLDDVRSVINDAQFHEYLDPAEQQTVWQARSSALPLLYRKPGRRQPTAFIEDAAVPVENMPQYIAAIQEILGKHGLQFGLFAHAGHGELHTRPYLDLHDPADVKTMQAVAEELFERVWELGGTISGEHGEGLVRVAFIRRQYGDLYPAMEQVKAIFDPRNLFNPGKIINDDPQVMTRNLRFANHARDDRTSNVLLNWDEGEYVDTIERCNGNGACRQLQSKLAMCPIYKVKRDESASPRAHANMMRHVITGMVDRRMLTDPQFKAFADTCVNCKMCRIQCPSGVNIPKLMLEARAQYVASRGLDRTCWFLSRSELVSTLGTMTAPLANFGLRLKPFRPIMEWVTGIDRRRAMPRFARGTLLGKVKRHPSRYNHAPNKPVARVAYFVDMYANYNDHALGQAVIDVLRHNDVEVVVPLGQVGAAMPPIDYGDLDYAKPTIARNVAVLADMVRQGYTVVTAEPTAALCLKEEYLDVAPSDDARLVAQNTVELTDWLRTLHRQGDLKTDLAPIEKRVGYHSPCHLKAMQIGMPGWDLMHLIPGLQLDYIDQGCCGIAGTFGFQKRHFDTSMAAGADLLNALANDRYDIGASECATCKMQMEQGTGKPAIHPIKLLAQSYGLIKDVG